MDERLRRLARLQAEDPSYIPQYLRELMRVGYLSVIDVESAAYLGDVSALQIFPHPNVQSLTYQPSMHDSAHQARIRQIEAVARMAAVIQRTMPPKLQEIMLRILEGHYSDDRVSQTIESVRERLATGGSPELDGHLSGMINDIRDQPFVWSLTEHMDQDHRRMVANTLDDILEYDEQTGNYAQILHCDAIIDLQTVIDLSGCYARRIGFPETESEQMTIDHLRQQIVEVLLTPVQPG